MKGIHRHLAWHGGTCDSVRMVAHTCISQFSSVVGTGSVQTPRTAGGSEHRKGGPRGRVVGQDCQQGYSALIAPHHGCGELQPEPAV